MTPLSSLTNRLFVAMALLAVLSIGAATYYAASAVTAQAEGELRRGLDEAGTLVDEYRGLLLDHFSREARLVADLPLLKAAVSENHPPTLRPIAEDYQKQLNADFFLVTNPKGEELARLGAGGQSEILQVVSVPISIGEDSPQVLGTLSVGFSLDARAAARFKALTNTEIVFASGGAVRHATLPPEHWPALGPLLTATGITHSVRIADEDYIAVTRPLSVRQAARDAAAPATAAPIAVILRSRTERLQFLSGVYKTVFLMALAAILAATLASYAIARTVTRPLGSVTNAMRDMAATGDLTRRIPIATSGSRWEDEDARLLASSFNSMTDSIARFQREAAQRERLSSLGRLSTVVAHEIRNPLMIIKTALRTLRAPAADPEQQRAVHDIDEEVERLNRIVSEVLDFARPIKFELERVDLNALCRDAARAASVDGVVSGIRLDLAATLPPVVSDAERLRLSLVNILTNARHAVAAAGRDGKGEAIRLSTGRTSDGQVTIRVRDTGAGIAADDLPRIFDPFFTTRRTGTGLGLAITRNIIEGLGGSIRVTSEEARGTEVTIALPADQAEPR